MPTYRNGEVPYSVVSVVLASGTDSNGYWEFRTTPATAARWAQAKAYALAHFGRNIYIRTGWNIYRPLQIQKDARARACASGNCAGASVGGRSSHGGNWNGRDCLAIDVNPNGLSWAQVDEAMESAGFSARLITEAMSGIKGGERWHYIDFNAFGAVPVGGNETAFPTPEPIIKEELMELVIVAPNGVVVHFAPGIKHDFASQEEYGLIAADLERIRAHGGTDALALPPLNEVQPVSWESYIRFCAYFNVPTAAVFPEPVGSSAEIAAAVEERLRDEFAAIPEAVADVQHERLAD